MLTVYLDESGTHEGSQVVTVAAAFATTEVWSQWTQDWNFAKHPINILHAVDANGRTGEFKDWSQKERNTLVARALTIIPKHKIGMLLSGIDRASLNEHLKHRPDIIKYFGHPYVACLHWVMASVVERAKILGYKQVELIHEENQFTVNARETFQYLKRNVEAFKSIEVFFRIGLKNEHVPLQCADWIAYEGYKEMQRQDGTHRKSLLCFNSENSLMFKGYARRETSDMARDLIAAFDEIQRRNSTIRNLR